ncbi:tRNA (guanine-N(7)-)-methyltransferase non-catalytic subunit WDR4 [Procambarus clarkii]|uniref:tRNA (guanine-N(7)-)-methyltransferase non-catalytic subunit WDR4 n=1 Tax=Procambarus clarkii TaxID=6728 RepID=UPI001E6747BC|nr:tRNA (guanine-N(7)-)-methyltransferase non-catalytic subunit WDR4-like [Procambarus clarkii]
MGRIEVAQNFIAFCCGNNVLVYDGRNSETQILNVPNMEEKHAAEKHTTKETNGNNTSSIASSNETQIMSVRASPDGHYLAVASETKAVTVWCTRTWALLYTHDLVKRPMAIVITSDSSTLLVADKSGDVYNFPLKGCQPQDDQPSLSKQKGNKEERMKTLVKVTPKPLLGHLSMLLDLTITEDSKYIITCDRDEKIRVSHYPNSYNIEAFCLGHREFVTQVDLLPKNNQLILSCSGDGTLRLWNYLKGECLACSDTREQTTTLLHHYQEYVQQKNEESEEIKRFLLDYPAVKSFALYSSSEEVHSVAALLDRIPAVFVYRIEGITLKHISTKELEAEPRSVAWSLSGELIVLQEKDEEPLSVFELVDDNLQEVAEHWLVSLGKKQKHHFTVGHDGLNLDVLYKQRYDNVADYLKKKEERIAMEKAAKDGLIPLVKKGRWSK